MESFTSFEKGRKTMALTWKQIDDRCEQAAKEIVEDCECEDDIYDEAWQEVDSWDWIIYNHYGMEIVQQMGGYELSWAEEQWHDMRGEIDESFGIYELASQLAFFFLVDKVQTRAMELWQEREES
jgi:hypoxanthine phosphoribosyltransferase